MVHSFLLGDATTLKKNNYSILIGYIVLSVGKFVQFMLLFVSLYSLLYYYISYYVIDV